MTVLPAIIAIRFKDDKEKRDKHIGNLNMFNGIGLMLGPVLSSLLYNWLNYDGTFFFFSAFILVVGLLSISMVPADMQSTESQDKEIEYVNFGHFF